MNNWPAWSFLVNLLDNYFVLKIDVNISFWLLFFLVVDIAVIDGQFFPPQPPPQAPINQGPGPTRKNAGYCPLEDFTAPCDLTIRQCYDDEGCQENEKCCFTSQRLNELRQCIQGCNRALTPPRQK